MIHCLAAPASPETAATTRQNIGVKVIHANMAARGGNFRAQRGGERASCHLCNFHPVVNLSIPQQPSTALAGRSNNLYGTLGAMAICF